MKNKHILIALCCLAFACNSVPEVNTTCEIIVPQNGLAPLQDSASEKLAELIKNIDGARDEISLRYGTSFGMCTEYCLLEMKITSVGIKYTESAWNMREDLPKLEPKVKAVPFSQQEWNALPRVARSQRINQLALLLKDTNCHRDTTLAKRSRLLPCRHERRNA